MLNDTSDISYHTQQVTVFSYEVEGTVHERFWEFFNSKADNSKGLAEHILEQLSVVLNGDSDRLIAQTYDGAAIMYSEKGAHTIIKQSYQNAHKFNLITEKAASQNPQAHIFFSSLAAIPMFLVKPPS
jgi:hypothetical protein